LGVHAQDERSNFAGQQQIDEIVGVAPGSVGRSSEERRLHASLSRVALLKEHANLTEEFDLILDRIFDFLHGLFFVLSHLSNS
jgi:hypothetical protein